MNAYNNNIDTQQSEASNSMFLSPLLIVETCSTKSPVDTRSDVRGHAPLYRNFKIALHNKVCKLGCPLTHALCNLLDVIQEYVADQGIVT